MGMMMKVLGGVIVAIGAVLFLGNVTGKLRTFPFAGYATIAAGGAVLAYGRRKEAEEAAARLNLPPR
jgi:hypothetical protein